MALTAIDVIVTERAVKRVIAPLAKERHTLAIGRRRAIVLGVLPNGKRVDLDVIVPLAAIELHTGIGALRMAYPIAPSMAIDDLISDITGRK